MLRFLRRVLLRNHALWRTGLDGALSDLVPIGRQAGTITLSKTLHHGTLGIIVGILVDLREELVQSLITIGLVLIIGCLLCQGIPVLGLPGRGWVCWSSSGYKFTSNATEKERVRAGS